MNSIMERWIQACRHELLDRTLIWNQVHLLHTLGEYERHRNRHRPSGYREHMAATSAGRLSCTDEIVGTHSGCRTDLSASQ
jgi:hypothetical protein